MAGQLNPRVALTSKCLDERRPLDGAAHFPPRRDLVKSIEVAVGSLLFSPAKNKRVESTCRMANKHQQGSPLFFFLPLSAIQDPGEQLRSRESGNERSKSGLFGATVDGAQYKWDLHIPLH